MRGRSSGAMPMPVSLMHSVFGGSKQMETAPPLGVYLTALVSSCSMTKESHFSSVRTVVRSGSYSSVSFFPIKSPEILDAARLYPPPGKALFDGFGDAPVVLHDQYAVRHVSLL